MSTKTHIQKPNYLLYYNPYSICSLMVLYTLAIKGQPVNLEELMAVETKLVDIFNEEQLSEHFLCEINDHGQVPVLLGHETDLEAPIADSLQITFWLASKYPALIPKEKEEEIRQNLVDLHALNYFSLSFPGRPQIAAGFEAAVNRRLAQPGISDRYRKALEFKLGVVKRDKSGGIQPDEVAKNEKRAKELLASLEKLVDSSNTWIHGESPNALDAHLVVFIARMTDVGRETLIPDKLKQYGRWAMQKPEWITMMGGRNTMVPK